MTRVLLVDDHVVVRQGLRVLLEQDASFRVVGEASGAAAALQVAAREQPDVVVLDLLLPGANGLELISRIRQAHPGARVVILSMQAQDAYIAAALKNGAAAYVLKGGDVSDLMVAIRSALAGRRYLSPEINPKSIDKEMSCPRASSIDLYEKLTNRERQVLALAAQGLNNTQVGSRLGISPRTVEIHRSNLMRKLGLRTFSDMVCYAAGRGIIQAASSDSGAAIAP